MASVESDHRKNLIYILLFCMLAFAFLAGLQPIWECDVWWHLRVGEWIVQHHRVPTTDMFSSISPNAPWRSFNWLFEVIIYGFYRSWGIFGLRLFASMCLVSGLSLWFIYFLRQTRNCFVAFVLSLLLFNVFIGRIQVRPHLCNFIFEAALLIFLQSRVRLEDWRQRFCFFLLIVVWTNIHNPFAALNVAIIWISCGWRIVLEYRSNLSFVKNLKPYRWILSLSALGFLLNPYGISLIFSGYRNIAPVYETLGEWKSPIYVLSKALSSSVVLLSALPVVSALIFIGTVIFHLQKKEERSDPWLENIVTPGIYLAMSQTSVRFVYLSLASLAWSIGYAIPLKRWSQIAMVVIAGWLGFSVVSYHFWTQGGLVQMIKKIKTDVVPGLDPSVAVPLFQNAHLEGRVYASERHGGYLLWFAKPIGGVSSDSRNNMSPEVYQATGSIQAAVRTDDEKILENLRKLHSDIAVLPTEAFPFSHWPVKEWIRIAHDENFEVFLRTDDLKDIKLMRDFLHLPISASPIEIQASATHFFGERYYEIKKGRIAQLKNDHTESAVHELAVIEWIAGHDDQSLQILFGHLKENPNCLWSATKIARILHDEGRIDEAKRFFTPVSNVADLPIEAKQLWEHLKKGQ